MKTILLSILFLFNSFFILAQFGPQQIISTTTITPYYLLTPDIDNDGASDVFCYSGEDYKMRWYRNLDGQGTFSDEIIISENTALYISIDFVDIDSDGDKDLIYLENNPRKLEWLENIDGQGNFGSVQVILENQEDWIFSFTAIDIDNDNDTDLIVHYSNTFFDWIVWYENLDGLGNFGEEQLLVENLMFAYNPLIIDIDNDGYLDILTSSEIEGPAKLIWFKNLGDVTFSEEIEIFHFDFIQSDQTSIIYINYVDINTDNQKDLVIVGHHDDYGTSRFWIENIDNQGTFENFYSLLRVSNFYDMDNDGDNDMLSGNLNSVFWIENVDGLGDFSTQHIVSNEFHGRSLATDVNNDGLIDVVSSSSSENKIVWFQNGVLGTEDNNKQSAILYPNPTNNKVSISSETEIETIEVYNILGERLTTNIQKNTVDLSNFNSGVYFITIQGLNGSIETYKIIKE